MRWCLYIGLVLLMGCGTTPPQYRTASHSVSRSQRGKTTKRRKKRRRLAKMPKSMKQRCQNVLPLFHRVAKRHNLEPALLVGIARVESGFRPQVVSRAGAVGLMQVMPSTGAHFRCGNLRDVAENAECGARVLRRYLDRYDGNLTYGLSAYNAGFRIPNRARKHRRLPKNMGYVEKVLKARARYLREGCS